jgi:transcriptional repressor NrdR
VRCPYCGHREDRVIDSRETKDGAAIRRRRECLKCTRRFTTYEHIEEEMPLIKKNDGRWERFDSGKLMNGLLKACQKRPVSRQALEKLVDDVEKTLFNREGREVTSNEIGEIVMKRLHDLDEVAYVRFASVYRQFKDITEFMDELKVILDSHDLKGRH